MERFSLAAARLTGYRLGSRRPLGLGRLLFQIVHHDGERQVQASVAFTGVCRRRRWAKST
jgi:hypothetical protein